VKASLQRIIVALQRLKEENISVLLASLDTKVESKERNQLFPRLVSTMDHVVSLEKDDVLSEHPGRQDHPRHFSSWRSSRLGG
jgi:hypothetical protein